MENRDGRLQALIAKNIRDIVTFEIKNENIDFLTITDIDVSSDRSYTKVYVSFFAHPKENLEKLNKLRGYVRSSLSVKLNTRRVPEIQFILDDSYDKFKKVDDALKREEEKITSLNKIKE
ncbi:MAG TPA: 30S ribosome-binding factor RbfA [Candidatus Onthovivens sp.]|nr:30S ribosome-binding factor RbfA [Candidatus Onthovivens sp.]